MSWSAVILVGIACLCVGAIVALLDVMCATRAERRIVQLLWTHGELTGRELVEAGATSRSRIYVVLARLQAEGLVKRNRRRKYYLSRKGRLIDEHIHL
jgi:predicted transcriptional regulator